MPHAGVCYFDGRPTGEAWAALATWLRPLSVDGEPRGLAGPGIALGCAVQHVWTNESSAPVETRSGMIVAWDGRLDNRDELIVRFGADGADGASDAHVAGVALDRLGIDGFRALVGEWSAAVWDPDERTLHLARDHAGVRPLYYAIGSGCVRWSTDLAVLVDWSDRRDALTDRFAAAFVAGRVPASLTPYEGIHGVEPGTRRSFASSGSTAERFWSLRPRTIRYRDPHDYTDRLRELWGDAVRGRLRTSGTVWAELSGGFDSSAVVCMADRLIKAGLTRASRIQPMSYITLESDAGDERRFIAEVERQVGVASHVIGVEASHATRDPDLDALTPMASDGVGLVAAARVSAAGGRIVLSGRMGDAVMGCEPDNSLAVFDALRAGRYARALADMRRWSRATRKPLVEIAANVWASRSAAGVARQACAESAASGLLTPRVRTLVPDLEPLIQQAIRDVNASRRRAAAQISLGILTSVFARPIQPRGLVHTFPFAHRPLVEYVLSIPGEQLSEPGQIRALMRRAFDGIVPPRILARVSKGYYPPAMTRLLRARASELRPADALEIVQRGWIDPRALDVAVHRLTGGGGGTYAEVWRASRLEQWLASRTRRAPAAIPHRKEVRSHEVLNT